MIIKEPTEFDGLATLPELELFAKTSKLEEECSDGSTLILKYLSDPEATEDFIAEQELGMALMAIGFASETRVEWEKIAIILYRTKDGFSNLYFTKGMPVGLETYGLPGTNTSLRRDFFGLSWRRENGEIDLRFRLSRRGKIDEYSNDDLFYLAREIKVVNLMAEMFLNLEVNGKVITNIGKQNPAL